jgi:hypothetical protein
MYRTNPNISNKPNITSKINQLFRTKPSKCFEQNQPNVSNKTNQTFRTKREHANLQYQKNFPAQSEQRQMTKEINNSAKEERPKKQ